MGRALGTEISGRSPHKKAIVPLHLELLHLISREEDDLASVSLWPSGRPELRFPAPLTHSCQFAIARSTPGQQIFLTAAKRHETTSVLHACK